MTKPAPVGASPSNIEKAGELIRAGELVGMPTDTIYGLAADATNDAAVARVFAAKGRPKEKPLIVLVGSAEDAALHGEFTTSARRLAAAFWPGPLTLVLKRRPDTALSRDVNPGGDTVSLRVPGNDITRALIAAAARPLTAPSANPSGAPSPRDAESVANGLGAALAMVLDGGESTDDIGSTVLTFIDGEARILREGAVSRAEIERVLGSPVL